MKPTLFIGSSKERRAVAYGLKEMLSDCADVTVWDEPSGFPIGDSLLGSLTKIAGLYDFAILVFGQDDCTMMSGKRYATVRDNVLFELGLFIGAMGRERAFWLSPRGDKAPKFPRDLDGIVHLEFDEPDLADQAAILNSLAETRPRIYQSIMKHGFRCEVVPMKRALCLGSSEYEEKRFKQDLDYIHDFFSKGAVESRQGVTADCFYEYFSPGKKWNMVHLALYLDPENQNMRFDAGPGERDSLPIQAVESMIKESGAALVVIITCDSLRLGQQLARFTKVVAGYKSIAPSSALDWAKVFYKELSVSRTLFQAFDKAQDLTGDPGLVLLARKDIKFRRLSPEQL